jgi:hypothetical protein
MAGVLVPAYQQFLADKRASIEKEFQNSGKTHQDAVMSMQHLLKVLCDFGLLLGFLRLSWSLHAVAVESLTLSRRSEGREALSRTT